VIDRHRQSITDSQDGDESIWHCFNFDLSNSVGSRWLIHCQLLRDDMIFDHLLPVGMPQRSTRGYSRSEHRQSAERR